MIFTGQQGVLLEFGHGFDGLFNGSLLVDSVARVRGTRSVLPTIAGYRHDLPVVKVDIVRSQPLQRLFTRLLAVLWRRIDLSLRASSTENLVGKLGRQKDLAPVSCPLEPLSKQLFRVAVDVGACGIGDQFFVRARGMKGLTVPMSFSQFVRSVEHLESFFIAIDLAIEGRESPGDA